MTQQAHRCTVIGTEDRILRRFGDFVQLDRARVGMREVKRLDKVAHMLAAPFVNFPRVERFANGL